MHAYSTYCALTAHLLFGSHWHPWSASDPATAPPSRAHTIVAAGHSHRCCCSRPRCACIGAVRTPRMWPELPRRSSATFPDPSASTSVMTIFIIFSSIFIVLTHEALSRTEIILTLAIVIQNYISRRAYSLRPAHSPWHSQKNLFKYFCEYTNNLAN